MCTYTIPCVTFCFIFANSTSLFFIFYSLWLYWLDYQLLHVWDMALIPLAFPSLKSHTYYMLANSNSI